ncbi:MAG: PmoA family protein [Ginsengibacter sp.]
MIYFLKCGFTIVLSVLLFIISFAQKKEQVKVIKNENEKKVDILIDEKLFTSFLYPDTLEKPVLYPLIAANGTIVTRGFPLDPKPGEPIDHPHHVGLWFTYENVNGLDFWNNSFAIPEEKKHLYGWIRTDSILETSGGKKGVLSYHANWTNKQKDVLLEETTRFEFSCDAHRRVIDRITVLKANSDVLFADAKDGLLGIRVAHELQIPTAETKNYTDDKGNVTEVKAGDDKIANGNYITSEGKKGNDAWSTRAKWCKMYAKMGNDSISIAIIDYPKNPNYPTYWHARGYGLFAANPLGEKIFTNSKSSKNLKLKKGESVQFIYRIIIADGSKTISEAQLNEQANSLAKKY